MAAIFRLSRLFCETIVDLGSGGNTLWAKTRVNSNNRVVSDFFQACYLIQIFMNYNIKQHAFYNLRKSSDLSIILTASSKPQTKVISR